MSRDRSTPRKRRMCITPGCPRPVAKGGDKYRCVLCLDLVVRGLPAEECEAA